MAPRVRRGRRSSFTPLGTPEYHLLVLGVIGVLAFVGGVAMFVGGADWGLLLALLGATTAVIELAHFGRSHRPQR
jgi:hypothetical protein